MISSINACPIPKHQDVSAWHKGSSKHEVYDPGHACHLYIYIYNAFGGSMQSKPNAIKAECNQGQMHPNRAIGNRLLLLLLPILMTIAYAY